MAWDEANMNTTRITVLIASLAFVTGCGSFPSFDVRICTPSCDRDPAPVARQPMPAPPPPTRVGWPAPPPPHVPPTPTYPQVRHPAPPSGCPWIQPAGTPQYCNPTVAPRPPGAGAI